MSRIAALFAVVCALSPANGAAQARHWSASPDRAEERGARGASVRRVIGTRISFGFDASRRRPGAFNGDRLELGLRGGARWRAISDPLVWSWGVSLDQSWFAIWTEPNGGAPFQKARDEARAHLEVRRPLKGALFLYAGTFGRGAIFPTSFVAGRPTRVTFVDPRGALIKRRTALAGESIGLSSFASPAFAQQGLGLGAEGGGAGRWSLMAKGGPSARQSLWRGGSLVIDSDGFGDVTAISPENKAQWGGEWLARADLRLSERIRWSSDLVTFWAWGDDRPVLEWSHRARFDLGSRFELSWFALFGRPDAQIEPWGWESRLELSWGWDAERRAQSAPSARSRARALLAEAQIACADESAGAACVRLVEAAERWYDRGAWAETIRVSESILDRTE